MNLKTRGVVAIVLVLMMSCNSANNKQRLKSGDVLFRGRQSSALSQAIDEVTQTDQANHYTHMGVVDVIKDEVWIIHAAPVKGVCKETLAQFCNSTIDSTIVGHYRIKKASASMVTTALDKANSLLGQHYNFSYILEDEGYYCSEFVYEIFANDSVFQLEPMTFINPSNGQFHEGWINHYNKLDIDIPEGKLGCNPNGMANSNELEFIQYLN